ncbi:hypothetical protein [Mucilaginibacter terrae]|uniref:DUF4293 family protein n=1 Tax=Mucilaginibacter terrae TaxID=1955052 RepID=A0ABU3H0V9_9SPHI|nr:hypothetical protein [Mucilaginibacter terrae]MDT3405639.1 hypothetical protein [Mucilaginibacter terrae]
MSPKAFLSFFGFVLLLAGTFCPLLRAFGLKTFDLYAMEKAFGMVVLLMAVVGIACLLLRQFKIARIAAFIGLGLVALVFIAAWFKVHTTFSFIPFKGIAGFFTNQIKFKWGWYLLFAGPVISILANPKERFTIPQQTTANGVEPQK